MNIALSNGETVPVDVRRRRGARYLRLRLGHANQVLLSAPWHCPGKEIARFLRQNRHWVETHLASAPEPRTLGEWLALHPQLTGSGDIFSVRLEWVVGGRSRYFFERGGSVIVLRVSPGEAGSEGSLLRLVRGFARDVLHCRVAYHAQRLGLRYDKISVRDQSGRWGSCSSEGGISLNWRLVLLSPPLQDYIILHELAHLSEPNHSPRFWKLLEQYDEARKLHEAELETLAPEIMRVGRA
ncbi:MAG: M48 family metallopeptidase [Opitutales bacterium]